MEPRPPGAPAGVKSASLADAVRKQFGHRAHLFDLMTPTPGRVLYGEVVTMAFVPVRDDRGEGDDFDFFTLLERAVGDTGQGKVVVMANYGASEGAVAGGTRLARAEQMGVAGILTNGRMRDLDELAAYSLAAYCRGETPHAGSAVIMAHAVNVPVALDGVTVFPGDHVYADAGGAVVLPRGHAPALIEVARAVEASDATKVEGILGRRAPKRG